MLPFSRLPPAFYRNETRMGACSRREELSLEEKGQVESDKLHWVTSSSPLRSSENIFKAKCMQSHTLLMVTESSEGRRESGGGGANSEQQEPCAGCEEQNPFPPIPASSQNGAVEEKVSLHCWPRLGHVVKRSELRPARPVAAPANSLTDSRTLTFLQ
jgi:hypothetical protein